MLTIEGCRTRQRRLLAAMERERWDCFLTGNYRTVYYLTGCLSPPETPVIFLLSQDAGSVLVTSTKGGAAADQFILLETYSIQRSITHPGHDAAVLLRKHLAGKPHWRPRTGAAEPAMTPAVVQDAAGAAFQGIVWADATNTILALRKRKEADEIEEIRTSLRYCAVAYRAAKQAITPGRTELDVYNAMFAAIMQEAGTTVQFLGDFACGTRGIKEGGPPTRRQIQP